MGASSLSKRYALGLIKALKSEAEYTSVKAQLRDFMRILDASHEFRVGLVTPVLSREQKMELLAVLNREAGFAQKTMNFLSALVDENRMDRLREILEVMDDLWLESRGTVKMLVSSAIPMDDTLQARLKTKLEKALEKPVHLDFTVDHDLIAGIRIQRGSVAYDLSVAGNLRKLYRRIVDAESGDGGSTPVNSRQEL